MRDFQCAKMNERESDCPSRVICTGNPIPLHYKFLGASSSNAKFFFLPLRILLNIPYCKRTWTGAPDVYTFFRQERIGN